MEENKEAEGETEERRESHGQEMLCKTVCEMEGWV